MTMNQIQSKTGGVLLWVSCLLLQSGNPDPPTDPGSRACPRNKHGGLFDILTGKHELPSVILIFYSINYDL